MFTRGKKGKKNQQDEFFGDKSGTEEFRAIIDKNTSCTIYDQPEKTLIILKKDLIDYKIWINSTEAPIKNFINTNLEVTNFEDVIAERAILEKEIFPLNEKIRNILKVRDLRLRSIRLCVGREDDYVTIDEKDLESVDVIPTISGLKAFIDSHQRSIVGFSIREFNAKKGNVTFLNSRIDNPTSEIVSFKVRIISSLQQRGYYMQKHHKAYGLQLYIVLKLKKTEGLISNNLIDFLKDINIPVESIYLKRNSSIQNWISLECEMDDKNLKNYIQSKYEYLAHSDVSLIAEFCLIDNKLSFDIATKMAEMLNSMKMKKAKGDRKDGILTILDPEDIAAAGKIAASYFGIKDIIVPKDLNEKILLKSEKILNNYV
ncbi:MAG: hypothetical protein EAX96_03860 [Candidatus Lokiarchaeota archaeon]|nr:hypothetical protein [Candidatus Lokiarchaeota archaeon]